MQVENHIFGDGQAEPTPEPLQEPEQPFNIYTAAKFWDFIDLDRLSDVCAIKFP